MNELDLNFFCGFLNSLSVKLNEELGFLQHLKTTNKSKERFIHLRSRECLVLMGWSVTQSHLFGLVKAFIILFRLRIRN